MRGLGNSSDNCLILLGLKVGAPRSGDTRHGVRRDVADVINQEIRHYDHNDILISVGGLNVSALGLEVVHTVQYTNFECSVSKLQQHGVAFDCTRHEGAH